MGNHASRRSSSTAACKVILSDGSVTAFDGGTSVAELMLEHPQQFMVEFRALLTGGRPSPLPADHKLGPGMVYVMFPMKPGKAATVSPAEARQVLSRSGRSVLRCGSFPSSSSSSSKSSPLATWGRPEPSGFDENGKDELKAKAGKMDMPEFSSHGLAEAPEFLRRQLSGRLWKPSLHTIEERAPKRKVSHWLF